MTWEDILKQKDFDLVRPNFLVELLEEYGKEDVIDVLETMLKNNEQSLKEQNKALREFFQLDALKDRTIGNNNSNTYKESMEALYMLIDKEDLDISKLRYDDELEYIKLKEEFLEESGYRMGAENMLIVTLKQVIRELKKKEDIMKRSMRKKPQTKIAGLGRVPRAKDTGTAKRGRERMLDVDETSFDDESYEEQLAESTKQELLDAIEKLSQEDLVNIFVASRGEVKLRL